MLFNSYTFLLFFALVLGIYSLPLSWRLKKLHLLVASYAFYAAWNPPFVVLLWISTAVDWYCVKFISRARSERVRFGLLMVSLCVNLGLLGFFKYSGFLLENFTAAVHALGIDYAPPSFSIVLPVGISFYTFQTLSYTIDNYRRKMTAWPSPLDFALYVTFFPQLVAGPIVRASSFLPQCLTPKRATGPQFAWGMALLVLGLFEKVVIADGFLAPVVELVYDRPHLAPTFAGSWAATMAFAGQIFCDFAGYSTCAIGAAMCLGFALPENFRFPYAAIGFSDFWRRWHISLSTWLRDYLYVPLGGNRKGPVRTYVNLSLTMLLGGLWHGASWTFVVWGGLHGLYLIMERALTRTPLARLGLWKAPAGRIVLMVLTFLAVCLAWVFFRAETFSQAFAVITAMVGSSSSARSTFPMSYVLAAAVPTACVVLTHWILRVRTLEDAAARVPGWLLSIVLGAMIVAILMMPGEDRAFIYFQF